MINIPFLIVALVISKSVDWILQSQHQAKTKSDYTHPDFLKSLITHSAIYALYTASLTFIILGMKDPISLTVAAWALFSSHFMIDSRLGVKGIMFLKGLSVDQINSGKYDWLQLGIDQRLHELFILILAGMV